jgi:hypothetical protein
MGTLDRIPWPIAATCLSFLWVGGILSSIGHFEEEKKRKLAKSGVVIMSPEAR